MSRDERIAAYRKLHEDAPLTVMVNGVSRDLSPEEADETFARWAAAEEAREAEEAARRQDDSARKTLLAALESGTASSAQMQAALVRLLRREPLP